MNTQVQMDWGLVSVVAAGHGRLNQARKHAARLVLWALGIKGFSVTVPNSLSREKAEITLQLGRLA